MMKLLALDTSTDKASVAIFANEVMYTKENNNIKQHANSMLPMIDDLIKEAQINLHELDGIVFGCGPGSFTGLRVTCAIAKAFAYANDLPLFPVSSLLAIAYGASLTNINKYPILATLDARMHEVYYEYFTEIKQGSPVVASAKDINIPLDKFILAGVSFSEYEDNIPLSIQNLIVAKQTIYPLAEYMIRLVQHGVINPISAELALPMYVRNQVVQGEKRG